MTDQEKKALMIRASYSLLEVLEIIPDEKKFRELARDVNDLSARLYDLAVILYQEKPKAKPSRGKDAVRKG